MDSENGAIAAANFNGSVAFGFLKHRRKLFPRLGVGVGFHGILTSGTLLSAKVIVSSFPAS
ncbi:MAG: hypothetical protein WAM43_04935, partial [Terriglobales bacterium]